MSEWKIICRVEDIPVLGSRRVARPGNYEVVDDSDVSVRANTLNGFMFGSGPVRRFSQ